MPDEIVRLSVTLRGSARAAEKFVEAFRFLMVTTRLETGCLNCAVCTDPDSTVYYTEEWATEAELRRRVRSDRFTSLLSVIESANEPPDVRFDFVAATRGLDYVRDAREEPLD